MATATQIESEHKPSRTAAGAWDRRRARAFTTARRHSVVVRTLRIGLPITAVVLLASYGIFVQRTMKVGGGELTVGPVSLSTEYLTMHAPRYEGFNTDGSRYVVDAKSAIQDLKQQNEIKLNDIDGKLTQTNSSITTLKAVRGNYDSKANELELFENINIKSADGMTAHLTRAKVYIKENRIVSQEPVDVDMPTGTLRGNSMVLLQKSREVTFSDGVVARLKVQQKAPGPNASAAQNTSAARRMTSNSEPVDVMSPQLKIDDNKKTAVFSGGVRAVQGAAVLTARELEAIYEGGADPSQPATAPGSETGGRVKHLFARENVVLVHGSDRVTSDAGEFDTVNETSILTGNVVLSSGTERQANADRADMDSKSDTVVLTGSVTILQGKNVLKGRRLFVDQRNGTSQLSSPPDDRLPHQGGNNRITARLYQNDAKVTKPQQPASREAGPLKFSTDPTAPVDIEADVLDGNDKAKTATFRGNVLAVQGDFKIRTSELTATYTGNAGLALSDGASDATKGNAEKQGAQVQKITARKKVVVTSKDDQSATGDWADFDVKSNTITLGGDVILNQARNVARGPKLVIDMVTGEYRMETARVPTASPTVTTATTPAGDAGTPKNNTPGQIPNIMSGSGPTACGGRMCILIYPKDLKETAKQGAAGAARALGVTKEQNEPPKRQKGEEASDATSGWTSTTVRP